METTEYSNDPTPASPLVVWSAVYPEYAERMQAIADSCLERMKQKGELKLEKVETRY